MEAVCDTKGDLGLDMLDGMASMVDKSLAQQVDQAGGETRFVMLSIIREYALERLAESGDEPAGRGKFVIRKSAEALVRHSPTLLQAVESEPTRAPC